MNAKIAAAALAALLMSGSARAQDKPAPSARESVMTFFRHLKESLSQSAVQGERKKNRVGSVAAVRGADQTSSLGDPNAPVLKGDARSKKEKSAMAEDAEFAKAVDLVIAGRTDDGIKALEDFKTKHPKSHDLAKVQEAIDQAKALAGNAAPTPAAEASAAPSLPGMPVSAAAAKSDAKN
jgi:hypothetical protein